MGKLIFIDDDVVDHHIFQYMTRKYNSNVAITYTVQPDTVINYLEDHKTESQLLPDIIIIDLKMQGFDGYQFLKKFAVLCKHLPKSISVYVLSFSLHPKDIHLADTYPFIKKYIPKPLTQDQVKSILEPA